jgi:molybdate transport system substrate-binding protein
MYRLNRLHGACVILLLACGLLAACGTASTPGAGNPPQAPTSGAGGLTVFAASSLQESMMALGNDWRAAHPGPAEQYNFGGSQALLAQLRQGAPADLFATADKPTMDGAVASGLVESPYPLARNSLVVVVPHDNPGHITALADLAHSGLKIVLADKSVPVGNYTLQMLDTLAGDPAYGADFKRKMLANVISQENNVRQVLAKVQLGEADAGVVYGTDAQAANHAAGGSAQPVTTVPIPDTANVIAVYYVAVVKGGARADAARAFLAYATGDGGQAVLGQFGFLPAAATAAVPNGARP